MFLLHSVYLNLKSQHNRPYFLLTMLIIEQAKVVTLLLDKHYTTPTEKGFYLFDWHSRQLTEGSIRIFVSVCFILSLA